MQYVIQTTEEIIKMISCSSTLINEIYDEYDNLSNKINTFIQIDVKCFASIRVF